jgi:hypothetical protein
MFLILYIYNAIHKGAGIPLHMLKSSRGFVQIPKIAFIRKSCIFYQPKEAYRFTWWFLTNRRASSILDANSTGASSTDKQPFNFHQFLEFSWFSSTAAAAEIPNIPASLGRGSNKNSFSPSTHYVISRSASFTRAADFFLASFELPLEINNEKKNGAVNAPLAFGAGLAN